MLANQRTYICLQFLCEKGYFLIVSLVVIQIRTNYWEDQSSWSAQLCSYHQCGDDLCSCHRIGRTVNNTILVSVLCHQHLLCSNGWGCQNLIMLVFFWHSPSFFFARTYSTSREFLAQVGTGQRRLVAVISRRNLKDWLNQNPFLWTFHTLLHLIADRRFVRKYATWFWSAVHMKAAFSVEIFYCDPPLYFFF